MEIDPIEAYDAAASVYQGMPRKLEVAAAAQEKNHLLIATCVVEAI